MCICHSEHEQILPEWVHENENDLRRIAVIKSFYQRKTKSAIHTHLWCMLFAAAGLKGNFPSLYINTLLTESPDVSQVGGELLGVSLAQHLDRRGALRVADLLVALLQRVGLQTLPRQRACKKWNGITTSLNIDIILLETLKFWEHCMQEKTSDCSWSVDNKS